MTENPAILIALKGPAELPVHTAPPGLLLTLTVEQSPWYESPEELRAALEHSRRNERLLEWVRSQMRLRLSAVERRSIELYYFRGLNYREAADRLDVNATSAYRAVKRGLRKLRQAARDYPPRDARRRTHRTGERRAIPR